MTKESLVSVFTGVSTTAHYDGTVIKVETLPGGVDIQAWPRGNSRYFDGRVLLGVYVNPPEARFGWREHFEGCIAEQNVHGWVVGGEGQGVVLRVDAGVYPTEELNEVNREKLLFAFKEIKATVERLVQAMLPENEIRDWFCLWALRLKKEAKRMERDADANAGASLWREVEKELNAGRKDYEKYIRLNLNEMAQALRLEFKANSGLASLPGVSRCDCKEADSEIQTERSVLAAYRRLFDAFLIDFRANGNKMAFPEAEVRELKREWAIMSQTEEIIEKFKNAEHKGFELYVITGVWHLLCAALSEFNRQRAAKGLKAVWLQPLPQKAVERKDGLGKRSLIDLYFPAIKFAIECDEAQHKCAVNEANDELRTENLMEVLDCDAPFRIDATQSFVDINYDIECAVKAIMERVKKEVEKNPDFTGWVL